MSVATAFELVRAPGVPRLRWRAPAARDVLVVAGVTPVTLIAAAAFGVADLRALAVVVLVPVLAVEIVTIARHRASAVPMVVTAILAGLVATALYDAFRFAFIGLGLIDGDPIPQIGQALGLHPDWLAGYLWRYLGNGSGLAIAFFALGLRGVRAGVAYGVFVCAGLVVTLAVSPYGEEMLFKLEPITLVMATGGHVIFGAVLGVLAEKSWSGAYSGSWAR